MDRSNKLISAFGFHHLPPKSFIIEGSQGVLFQAMKIYRKILHEYPLPLTRSYERAVNGEEGKDLHDRTLLTFEAFVHWLGILALGAARPGPSGKTSRIAPEVLGRLSKPKLERPSRGIWVEVLRILGGQGSGFLKALGSFLKEPFSDPDLGELIQAISSVLAREAPGHSRIPPGRVFDLLVTYRNRTVGHGASMEPEAYASLSVPLFNGIGALLHAADFLLEYPAFRCEEFRHHSDGSLSAKILRLMGSVPVREPAVTLPEGLGPGSIFVLPALDASDWFDLSPFAIYREKSLFLYNGVGQDSVPRYLCFDDNSQVSEGKKEEILSGLGEAPQTAGLAQEAAPTLRLGFSPERIRAGETFTLRLEIEGVPTAEPLGVKIQADPDAGVFQFGARSVCEGLGKEFVPLSYHFRAVRPGPIRLEAEVTWREKCLREGLEITVQPGISLPFVGRQESSDRIFRWYESASCGLFVLRGEPGVGKSRLAQEIAFDIARKGATVVFGKGRKSFRFPFQPFREILLGLLHQVESEADHPRVLDFIWGSLRHCMPDEVYIADYFKTFLARESISPEQRAMVPYYWLQLFRRVGEGRPFLVVIDDFQWAEAESIQLLAEVLGLAHQREIPLKALAIVQPFGQGPEQERIIHLLNSKIRDLEADRIRVDTLDLRPLDSGEIDSLLDACFPGNSFRQDLPWIYSSLHQKTGGNPLFTEWVLKRLRSDGESRELSLPSAGQISVSLTPEWFEAFVPREIEFVLDQRLVALSDEAREATQVAAAIGDPFDLRLLEQLLGGMDALDAALPVLEKEELVFPSQDPIYYRFAHSLIPNKVYRDFSEKSRWKAARLHARIAEAMSSIYSTQELDRHSLVYANHLILGNRREEGLKYLISGAGKLLQQQLYASAVSPLEMAHTLIESGVEVEDRDWALLHYQLGETYRVLGRIDEALGALDSAAQKEVGRTGGLRAQIGFSRGSILVQRGELDAAEETFRSILSLELPENQIAGAVSGLASVERNRGHHREALRENLKALELREKAGVEEEVAISCVNVGNAHYDLGELDAAGRAFRRSIPIFQAKGLKNHLIYALSGLGNVFFRSDRNKAVKFYEEAMGLCRETGNRALLGVLHYNLGEIAMEDYRYTEAIREFELALGIMKAVGRRSGEAAARCRKAELHRILGDLGAARGEQMRALEISLATKNQLDLAAAHLEGSRLALSQGNSSGARQEVEEALRSLSDVLDAPVRLGCAQVLIDLGELERARGEIEEASKGPQVKSETDVQCLLEHLRGLVSPDQQESYQHLKNALELSKDGYGDLPRLFSDLAKKAAPERAGDFYVQAVEILKQRAGGIIDEAARRKYLFENPIHREILSQAGKAEIDPAAKL